MNFSIWKKRNIQAFTEMLKDGRKKMNLEMKKPKFNNYSGAEVFLDAAVRAASNEYALIHPQSLESCEKILPQLQ